MSNQILHKWLPLWKRIEDNSKFQIIQHNFPDSAEMRKRYTSDEIEKTLFQVNTILQQETGRDLIWVNVEANLSIEENGNWLDIRLLEMARIPFKNSNIPRYIFALLKAIRNFVNQPLKLIIVDLDGTLWSNNLAEEGPNHLIASINLSKKSENGVATFLKNCGEEGVLLAVCSKNNLDDVLKVLCNLENFPLIAEDFVDIKANWESKTKNVLEIISKLQFSQESVCFIDNSIEQCAEIKSSFPKMLVLHSDEFELAGPKDFLKTGIFEFRQLTKEDFLRKKSYVINKKLFEAQESDDNLQDFLIGLEMSCTFSEITSVDMPRVNQMLERTNQFRANKKFDFNFQSVGMKFLKFELVDKYTSYGIVSIIATSLDQNSIIINQWLMSCRVFGRGLESKVIEILQEIYGNEFPQELGIDFVSNDRNDYLLNLINSLGFKFDSAKKMHVCQIDSIRNTLNYISHDNKNF
jgi:FkbH-like protein